MQTRVVYAMWQISRPKEKLLDFKMRRQIWTPPTWRVLREVGVFSNAPAYLNYRLTLKQ